MRFYWTKHFKKDYKHLPLEVRERTQVALKHFVADSRHPGLQVKKMEGVDDIWEIRVTDNYRITFQFVEGGALLRRVGTHNVLRRP